MQRVTQHFIIFTAVIILAGCFSGGGGNIKQAYYDIRITDGISTGEAKITALYHANLDRIFDDVSAESLSAQILSQGNFWRVTLVQNKGRGVQSAVYLVNKINGNTKSINDSDIPVNFTSDLDNKVVSDELSDVERRALSRHAKLKERNAIRNSSANEAKTENSETITTNTPSISDSRSIRAFPPRRADGKVNTPGNDDNTRVNIDEESLVTILSSNNRITKNTTKQTDRNERPKAKRGVTPETLNAARAPVKTERKGGSAAAALQSPQATPTSPQKSANTTMAANKPAPEIEQARSNTRTTNNTTANRPPVNRSSADSRTRRQIGPRFVDAFPKSGASTSAQLATGSTLGSLTPRNTFSSASRNAFKNNESQPAQPVFENSSNTTTNQNHPVYQLKLLNEGFDAELSNRIQLKPDHDMDFSDKDASVAVTNTEDSGVVVIENVADAIANEALMHNVSPATVLTEPGETVSKLTQGGHIDTQSINRPDPDINTLGSVTPMPLQDTKIASLGKPPSMAEPFFTTKGDTVIFKGAKSGNKAILRKMKELVNDGYRTTVMPIMINGNKIRDEAAFYELPPGSHTITMRCDSIFTSSGNDKHYSYETEIKVAFVNAHEYILEAQTYRFENHIECASDIYDIRDSR